ncbi:uncharacterized protein LOC141600480 [Silene latifolia]|uniref:uncharacterized protein LOC141600480 n=1 Tax=Silene latifolia TaxID=37657 RepID=UPI003D78054B
MVYSSAPKSNNNNHHNEGWGMGLLFIFFHNNNNNNDYNNTNTTTRKRNSFSISSSSSSNLLLSKTQSTLSICALLLFTTLLLFTLISTFELQPPTSSSSFSTNIHNNNNNNNKTSINSPRRFLRHKPNYNIINNKNDNRQPAALQGIGQLYLRGTKAMSDLIVAHVSEEASPHHIRTFIRLLFHSGLLSRLDLVFVFPSISMQTDLTPLLNSESHSLITIVRLAGQLGRADLAPGLTRYLRPVGEAGKETLWGRRRGNSTTPDELTRPSYGSIVGFEASELDPEDALSGFLDHVPMRLRRWACYPMLLGRVRRNYKHVMLLDANNALVVSDPFTRVRNRSSESVFIWSNPVTRHGKRNPNQEQRSQVNPGVLIGGARGLRRFTNAALTEIVRVSIEHKGKNRNSVTESGVVNQLLHSGHLLKSINLITSAESIPDSGSLVHLNSAAESGLSLMGLSEYLSVVQRVNSGGEFNVDQVLMTEICASHKLFTSVYRDCLDTSRTKSSIS